MTGDPLDRIEAQMQMITRIGGPEGRELPTCVKRADVLALLEVARAARDLSGRIVDGPGFDLGEIFNAAGRLDAALARLDGPR